MAWNQQQIADLLAQPPPSSTPQQSPVPVSLNQPPITTPPQRQVVPVSLPGPVVPDKTGIAIGGTVYGDMTGMGETPESPLTPLQAAAIRRKAKANATIAQ